MKKKLVTIIAIVIGLPLIGVVLDACNLFDNDHIAYYEIGKICPEIYNLEEPDYYNNIQGPKWNGIDTLKYNKIYFRVFLMESTFECAYINPFIKSCNAEYVEFLPEGKVEDIKIYCDKDYSTDLKANQDLKNIFYLLDEWRNYIEIDDYIKANNNCESVYKFIIKNDFPPDTLLTCNLSLYIELSTGETVNVPFSQITIKQ